MRTSCGGPKHGNAEKVSCSATFSIADFTQQGVRFRASDRVDAHSIAVKHLPGTAHMLDYVLFHQKPFEMFCEFLGNKGIKPEINIDGESFEIRIPEDLDEELANEIEDKYDDLLMDNKALMYEEDEAGGGNFDIASIVCHLKDGSTSSAVVSPQTLVKVTSALSGDEFAELVAAIVSAVEDPNSKTHCDIVRDRRGSTAPKPSS